MLRRDTELPYDIEKLFLLTDMYLIASSKLDNMCYYPLACPSELIILSELIIVSLLSRRTEIDEVNS